MIDSESSDPDLLLDLRQFVAEHPQTCNAHVDALLRRAAAELERHKQSDG